MNKTIYIKKVQTELVFSMDSGLTWLSLPISSGSLGQILFQAKKLNASVLMIPEILKKQMNKCVALFSADCLPPIPVFPELSEINLISVNEKVASDGTILIDLSEEEINKALRFVFRLRPEYVFINLGNSLFNNKNEKILRNLLKLKNYKVIVSSAILL